ncbi:O-antigen ligase family protein [Vibrio breoganii]
MLSQRVLTSYIFIYFFLTGITWVYGEVGQGILGRIALSDLFAIPIVSIFIYSSLRINSFVLPEVHRAIMPLFLFFIASSPFALEPDRAIFESIVHLFSFVVSLSLFNLVINRTDFNVKSLFNAYIDAVGLIALLGLLSFFIFPNLFSNESMGGLSGTFRNTGQAGSFFGLSLAIIVPGYFSGIINKTPRNLFFTLLIFFALVFTFKRAAYIGFGLGLFIVLFQMLLSNRAKDKAFAVVILIVSLISLVVLTAIYSWGVEHIDGLRWRVESKLTSDGVDHFVDNFFSDNLIGAINAFIDHPVFGVGLGSVVGNYTEKYEVHSTYFALLATSGIVGVLLYIYFVVSFFYTLVMSASFKSQFNQYIYYFIPFLTSLFISWGYTYHLRKREFWILIFFISVILYLSKVRNKNA